MMISDLSHPLFSEMSHLFSDLSHLFSEMSHLCKVNYW